jgi:peptidyl-prolyl cis-trans isomerase C
MRIPASINSGVPPWQAALHRRAIQVIATASIGLALARPTVAGAVDTTAPSGIAPAGTRPVTSLPANPAMVLAAVASHLDQDPNLVMLTVDSLPITQADVAGVVWTLPVSFGGLSTPEIFRRAMEVLIRQKAMVLNARKLGLDQDPGVIRQGQIAFEKVLADAWLTRKSDAAVSDPALHARYDHDVAGKPGPDEVRARVILAGTEAEALGLIDKIRQGAEFIDLARQYSKDPTAAAGGDLGYVTIEAVSPEVGAAIFALSPGQVSAYPVRSAAGYFVVRVEGRRRRATPDFDEVRARLEQELRGEAVRNAVASLTDDVKLAPAKQPDAQTK